MDRPGVIRGEVILRFENPTAYAAFLETAEEEGYTILGRLDALRAVRVRRDGPAAALSADGADAFSPEPNFYVEIPGIPYRVEDRLAPGSLHGFGSDALTWLGIGERESLSLGEGVTVAVIDGGVQADTAFGEGQVETISLPASEQSQSTAAGNDGESSIDPEAHGTAVASIIAGQRTDVQGVAPGAEILNFPIMGPDGSGSSFALAGAIIQATDTGAQVINMSVGTYADSPLVRAAVEYAASHGVAMVAAAGNETYDEVAYPARYPGVTAVGAVDALGQQLPFSNSGQALDLSAPGLAVQVAQPGGETAKITGTSASAPFVSGAIAAVLSRFPDLSPTEAVSLLADTSNEAGAPGQDPAFGVGVLDVGRALQSRESGIQDVAVASHYSTYNKQGQPVVQVVVENRGTTPLHNLLLSVDLGSREEHRTISFLNPGESDFRELPVPGGLLRSGDDAEPLVISSQVSLYGGADAVQGNNQLRTAVRFSE